MTIANGSTLSATDILNALSSAGYLKCAASTTLTIATGAVTKTQNFHRIDTEASAASDDLDTISGGAEGDILFIRPANDARTVVIKHNTGNIQNFGNRDIALDDANDMAILVYDVNLSKWCCLSGGQGLPASVNVLGDRAAAGEFIQRGTVTTNTAGAAVTFPVAFTTVIGAWVTISGTTGYATSVASLATTGFTAYAATGSPTTCYWIAIGT